MPHYLKKSENFYKEYKKWSKFWSKNYRFFSEVQFENVDPHSPWYTLAKVVQIFTFLLSGWHFLNLHFFYFLLKFFYNFFLKIHVILRDTLCHIIWKKVKIFIKSIKKWSKFWSKNYRFFSEVQFENVDPHSPWYTLAKVVQIFTFLILGWHFLDLYFFYFLLKIFYDFFLKILVILRDTIYCIIWKKVKIFVNIY